MTASTRFVAAVILAMVLLSGPDSAHAYIDPGSGSIIIQAIVAAVVGMAVTLKLFWQKIKMSVLSLFSRRQKEEG